jgi:hypothetical protein
MRACRLVSSALIALAWNSIATGKVDEAARLFHDARDNSGPVTQSAASPAATGTGRLYLYRQGRFLGKITHFSAYVGDTFLAEIHNAEYASMEVPAGTVLITAAGPIIGKHHIPFGGSWASEPGCAGLKWRRLALESIADIEGCKSRIGALANICGSTVEGCFMCPLETIRVPGCNYQLNGASLGYQLLLEVGAAIRLKLDVEAGKTYYVRWSLSLRNHPQPYKMELVDEATGVKEIKHEHLAKETDEDNLGQVSIRPPATRSVAAQIASLTDAHADGARRGTEEIFHAIFRGDLEQVRGLIEVNADLVHSKDADGESALHHAVEEGHKDVVEFLLAKGADVNAKANNGTTPLHVAAVGGNKEVAELLLANRAEVNTKNDKGETPLQLAERLHHEDVAELLRQHGGYE